MGNRPSGTNVNKTLTNVQIDSWNELLKDFQKSLLNGEHKITNQHEFEEISIFPGHDSDTVIISPSTNWHTDHIAVRIGAFDKTMLPLLCIDTINLWEFSSEPMVKELLLICGRRWRNLGLSGVYCHRVANSVDLPKVARTAGLIFVPVSSMPKDGILVKPESTQEERQVTISVDCRNWHNETEVKRLWEMLKDGEDKVSIPLLIIARSAMHSTHFVLLSSPTDLKNSITATPDDVTWFIKRVKCKYLFIFLTDTATRETVPDEIDFLQDFRFGCETLHLFGTKWPEHFDEQCMSKMLLKQLESLSELIFDGLRGSGQISADMADLLEECGVKVTEIIYDGTVGDNEFSRLIYQTEPTKERMRKDKESCVTYNWNISVIKS